MKQVLLGRGFIGTMVVIVALGWVLDRDWGTIVEGLVRRNPAEAESYSARNLDLLPDRVPAGIGGPDPWGETDEPDDWVSWIVDFAFFCLTLSGVLTAWETACRWRDRWWNWWHVPFTDPEA
jgi:hypothetical protein